MAIELHGLAGVNPWVLCAVLLFGISILANDSLGCPGKLVRLEFTGTP